MSSSDTSLQTQNNNAGTASTATVGKKRRTWTPAEIDQLLILVAKHGRHPTIIGRTLGRSTTSVDTKISLLEKTDERMKKALQKADERVKAKNKAREEREWKEEVEMFTPEAKKRRETEAHIRAKVFEEKAKFEQRLFSCNNLPAQGGGDC